jgi:phage terminase large subunit-like protein
MVKRKTGGGGKKNSRARVRKAYGLGVCASKTPKAKKSKGGRPRLSDAEKARRGTLRPCRVRRNQKAKPKSQRSNTARPKGYYVRVGAQYAAGVLSGQIVACSWVKLACARQDRDRMRAATDGSWPYAWSDAEAEAACAFLERCPHVEGSWTTPTIELEPWQIFVVTCLFGWRQRQAATRRRFTTLYLEVARKAAKSTLMAGIALYHLMRENEPGASVVCGATTGQQARIVFGIMQKMVRRSAWLRDEGAQALANAIIFEAGSAKPVNSKASNLDGLNPSAIVLDESHAQSFELHDVLKSSQGARLNPLLACPTTAGYDLLSVGYAMRTRLTKVLLQIDGFESDHFLGLIYTLDDGDDWRDEAVWPKANPMLGISPTLAWVRTYAQDAKQTPGLEGEFRTKVCNQWLQSASSWLPMDAWDRCADPALRLADFKGQRCWIGADLAQIDDLAAVALTFKKDDLIVAFVRCYLPADIVDERARAVPAYREWADSGLLVLTEGTLIDFNRIEADIRAWAKEFNVVEIVFDTFGSTQIVSSLQTAGLPAIIEAKNPKSFTPPAIELEARVKHGRLRHDGNSLLKWAASNVVVQRRGDDSLLPKKAHAASADKIDPIDALLQAIGAMLRQPVKNEPTYSLLIVGGGARR